VVVTLVRCTAESMDPATAAAGRFFLDELAARSNCWTRPAPKLANGCAGSARPTRETAAADERPACGKRILPLLNLVHW